MKCDIYPSTNSHSTYLFVPAGGSLASLPPGITAEFQTPVWKTIEVLPGSKRVALDSSAALDSIQQTGYYVAKVFYIFEEPATP